MKVSITSKVKAIKGTVIVIASLILLYLLVSLYFTNHFFLGTAINGVRVSLKSYNTADRLIMTHMEDYKLSLLERNGVTEIISGHQIKLRYNKNNNTTDVSKLQNQLLWPVMLFKKQSYYVKDLITYNENLLKDEIDKLNCLNKDIVDPRDVSFVYSDGIYNIQKEVSGNKVNKDMLTALITEYLRTGKNELDLDKEQCYYKPKFTLHNKKTLITRDTLNKYVSAKIKYQFDNKYELIDGNVISRWLSVDDNLEVKINNKAVIDYIKWLANKYDTVGIIRDFKSSSGKKVEVAGGLYGWKINQKAEAKALINSISKTDIILKEPIYEQKAVSRGENDIGNSYIEINITRQHLWFYKNGKLITQGAVVTGNPGRGNATVTGTYFVIYKEKDSVLSGPGYDAKVTYWMPFFGNMGLHDARWRSAFGGQIYKSNGTHGCVNAPLYLAKKVFENIEEGIPVIIYEE
jgi:lipoprotein-anchoring transpeptidase ErfK/SrfK